MQDYQITITWWHLWLVLKLGIGSYLAIINRSTIMDARFYAILTRNIGISCLINPEFALGKIIVLGFLWFFIGPKACTPDVCRSLLSLPPKKYHCPICEDTHVVYDDDKQERKCGCVDNPVWQEELKKREDIAAKSAKFDTQVNNV